ncbi:complexin-3-like [Lissotriton helveticus]
MMKALLGAQVKQLTCCVPTKLQKDQPKPCEEEEEGLVARMRRKWSSEDQYQESVEEEKRQRDTLYAQKKAERAVMRDHFREKYQIPKNQADAPVRRGSNVKLSKDISALVKPEEAPEPARSFFGPLPNIENLDLSFLRKTTNSAMDSLRQGPQCQIM